MKRGQFLLIYLLTYPLRLLSFKAIHGVGRTLGSCLYYLIPKFRKRALSNVALATTLYLSPKQILKTAKRSLQNLAITFLEYAKLDSIDSVEELVTCVNPETAEKLMQEGKPPIFFCGHQANWELLFLEGTRRMKGVAIGRPVKNAFLYDYVLRIRQKYGGKIVHPKQAIKEGLRALKQGAFLGIVGDQGMPDSGYSSLFFGRLAWTSPMPALLAHRTGSPIIVATTERTKKGRYLIHYSDPLFPNLEAPAHQEVDRLMQASLALLENSIRKHPDEWLFIHNRWKQQTPGIVKKQFRHEAILIILPSEKEAMTMRTSYEELFGLLIEIKALYPKEFITIYSPTGITPSIACEEVIHYRTKQELFFTDYKFKLLFNFTPHRALCSHFKKQSVFTTVDLPILLKKGTGYLCQAAATM
ncbi:MAG: acyltransferase [Chlamydiota bacterium]|jgi:KDO2-lipid IV(A) lauroyltransferase